MADQDLLQPDLWKDETAPPCAVAYHFTLLDINKQLRYCCHGDKVHDEHRDLKEQWDNHRYSTFRKTWSDRYKENKGLCLGCAHHEENKRWGRVIEEYLAQHHAAEATPNPAPSAETR